MFNLEIEIKKIKKLLKKLHYGKQELKDLKRYEFEFILESANMEKYTTFQKLILVNFLIENANISDGDLEG